MCDDESKNAVEKGTLTLATDGTEPALCFTFSPDVGSSRGSGCIRGLKRWWRRSEIRSLWVTLRITINDNSRGWNSRLLRLNNLTARTEFDHVERTFSACDEMTAGNKDDLAWGRKAEKTFG